MNKKFALFFFSGTGNTWWVSKALSQELNNLGIEGKEVSLEAINIEEANKLIEGSDIIGFGFPTYGSDLPLLMKEFILNLFPVKDKEAFVFCTQVSFSGDGAKVGGDMLKEKGFMVKWSGHFAMPNNISVAVMPVFKYTNDRKKLDKILNKTSGKIAEFALKIYNNTKHLVGYNPLAVFGGLIQRVPFRMGFSKMRNHIQVDKERCINCMLCLDTCPSGNLFLDEGSINTKGVCILCCRCYNFCPVSAIKFMKKHHSLKKEAPYKGPIEGFDPRILIKD